MSFRFKDPGSMGSSDPKFDDRDRNRDRMMPIEEKSLRDDIDGDRGSRAPFGRGRRLSPPSREKSMNDRRDFDRFGRDEGPSQGRDRSPLRSRLDERFSDRDRDRDRFKRDEPPFPRRDDRDRDREREHRDRPLDSDIFRDKFINRGDDRGRFDGPPGMGPRFDLPDDARPLGYPSSFKGFFKSDMMKPNECEIIVVNKQQRAYAENVETRLKNLGIQVDLLFLKDEALLVQTIDDIARRGSLYAIVISPLNETHRSVTLNILYGTPQEHRNMPLDDSLKLISRNFHDHVRLQRENMDKDRLERGMHSSNFPADREIQFLLRLLADGRQLSVGEIETVIRYLTERRDKMKGTTSEKSAPPSLPSVSETKTTQNMSKEELAQKEKELQNRILHIMEETSNEAAKQSSGNVSGTGPDIKTNVSGLGLNVSGPGLVSASNQNQGISGSSVSGIVSQAGGNVPTSGANLTSATPSTYINFDNPSVQKALDSLMQSGPNLLKSLASTTPSSQTTQSMPTTEQSNISSDMGMSKGLGDMGFQRGRLGNMTDMGLQRGPGGIGEMGSQKGGLGMGDIGPQRGLGNMGDIGSQRGPGGMGDMGMRGGPGGMGDMGMRGGPGNMGDMGMRGSLGNMGDMGSQRGPGEMGDMGSQRGPGGMGDMGMRGGPGNMGDIGMRGGPGNMGDIGMRGPRSMGDMGMRGSENISDMGMRGPGSMNNIRGSGNIGDMGIRGLGDMGPRGMDERGQDSMGNQRGPGGNMNMQRGLGGLNEGGLGLGMGSMQDTNNMGMMGRSGIGGLGPRGMSPGSQFQGSQGMFPGNIPTMMGNRPPFMGGRRY